MSGLQLHVWDATGAAVPSRVSVRSVTDGRPHWPLTEHLRYDVVAPWGEERSFVCEGRASLDVPPGPYEVAVARGPEWSDWRSTLIIEPEHTAVAEAVVSRWIDPSETGWVSGDVHVHRASSELPLLRRAEGLDLGFSIGAHIDLDGLGGSGHLEGATHAEVERIMGGPGALIGLGMSAPPRLRAQAWEPFDDVVSDVFRGAGGHVDGEKVFWPSVPVLAALGKLDSVQLACNHFGSSWTLTDVAAAGGYVPESGLDSPRALVDWILELYYALLGCGFRLPATGGSGAGVMPNPVGASRTYAQLAGPHDGWSDRSDDDPQLAGDWLTAVARGRTFSTNGPLLELDVAGHGPGATVRAPGSGPVPVRIRASASGSLSEIGIVVDGSAVETWDRATEAFGTVELEAEVDVSRAGWMAARAFGRDDERAIRFAHTSPVWVDTAPGSVDRRACAAFVGRWLDWTAERLTAAEHETGRTLDGARTAIVKARRVIEGRVATAGGRSR